MVVRERVRRAGQRLRGRRSPTIPGGFDRVHDGLISGWFICAACGSPPTPVPALILDGVPTPAAATVTPRADVPGGAGFLLRFPARRARPPRVRVHCPHHPEQGMDLPAPAAWSVTTLGTIEHAFWPEVAGWVVRLSPDAPPPTLAITGVPPVPVEAPVPRPDVAVYLGEDGVGGYHVDLAPVLGYAQPEGTEVRLMDGPHLLGTARIRNSPLRDDDGWLPTPAGDPLDPDRLVHLARRLREAEVPTAGADWRTILRRLGFEHGGVDVEQWAALLDYRGLTPAQVAGWLAWRSAGDAAVAVLDPLPASLADDIGQPADLPARVRAWGEPILRPGLGLGTWQVPDAGVPGQAAAPAGQPGAGPGQVAAPAGAAGAPDPGQPPAGAAGRAEPGGVTVAGLVHHRSALGQNADTSLAALALAGIPAGSAPFVPGRGGWNVRLGPYPEAVAAMSGQTVLLHLPVDRVMASLAAQPALLATDRLIGYFMWEVERVPEQFHRALDAVDEVWTATPFVAEAFRAVTATPVHVTGHAVDVAGVTPVSRAEVGLAEDAFVVHAAFDANSTVARKNPNDAIDAFRLAFGDDPGAQLLLKIRNYAHAVGLARAGDPHARGLLSRLSAHRNVRHVTGEWSRPRALGLITMADCYVSLHRSEGYGYAIAESLLLCTPVVATGYSGCVDLLADPRARSVGYTMVELSVGEYFYWEPGMRWAQPDIGEAAEHLRRLRDDRDAGRLPSGPAAPGVRQACALARLSGTYRDLLVAG